MDKDEDFSPKDRFLALEEALPASPSDSTLLFQKKLLLLRYEPAGKGKDQYNDHFMEAWLMMRVISDAGISRLQKKRQIKEYSDQMKKLGILDFPVENDTEKALLHKEWEDFLKLYLDSCMEDRHYGSTLLGFVRLKKDSLTDKITSEFQFLTETFPELLGLKEEFHEFHLVAMKVLSTFH